MNSKSKPPEVPQMGISHVPLVQATLIPERSQIMIAVMPGVTDPVMCLMQVSAACVNAAQEKLAEERAKHRKEPSILRAMPGMRVPRNG